MRHLLALRPLHRSLVGRASLLLSVVLAAACSLSDNPLFGPGDASTATSAGAGGSVDTPVPRAERVDVLLTIDNSRSMADKQQILAVAVPQLVASLTNPACVGSDGAVVPGQPTQPDDDCPEGSERVFAPVTDMHIGVITTSLGGHGSDSCRGEVDASENDRGRLVVRTSSGGVVTTYDDLGFLAWDPDQALDPPGEDDVEVLGELATRVVTGTGQTGCGYESTLESWYRFLIDPTPSEEIVLEDSVAVPSGVDEVLLQQRADFLRPDSLLLVVMLSDENDCSIRSGGQFYLVAQVLDGAGNLFHLPRARAACEQDPTSPCCRSCGQSPAAGCDTSDDLCDAPLELEEDNINLRCYEQKRRFGIDFLHPIDRYVDALSAPEVQDRDGDVVSNPLYVDLDPSDAITGVRDRRHVLVTAITGVPWQDIARQTSSGEPSLLDGLDAAGEPVGGYQSSEELFDNGTWALVLGEPSQYYLDDDAWPTDPLMRESVAPRQGVHPITGEAVAAPDSEATANSINGHEYTVSNGDDLQYACVFRLPVPRNCAETTQSCDCANGGGDNPLCQNPETGEYGLVQYRAKAYPGLRQLELIRNLGAQGVVASICPAQVANATLPDFGYAPAVRSLVEAVRPALGGDP